MLALVMGDKAHAPARVAWLVNPSGYAAHDQRAGRRAIGANDCTELIILQVAAKRKLHLRGKAIGSVAERGGESEKKRRGDDQPVDASPRRLEIGSSQCEA
jgi:hypothetical protein